MISLYYSVEMSGMAKWSTCQEALYFFKACLGAVFSIQVHHYTLSPISPYLFAHYCCPGIISPKQKYQNLILAPDLVFQGDYLRHTYIGK